MWNCWITSGQALSGVPETVPARHFLWSMEEAEENAEEAKEDMEVYYPDPYDIPEIPIIKREIVEFEV